MFIALQKCQGGQLAPDYCLVLLVVVAIRWRETLMYCTSSHLLGERNLGICREQLIGRNANLCWAFDSDWIWGVSGENFHQRGKRHVSNKIPVCFVS